MNTVYLNTTTWDFDIDAAGNIAMAEAPYAVAQDVASACRLWKGEAVFDTDRGIPYEEQVLGHQPPQRLLAGWYEDEAELVPNVETATVVLQYAQSRQLTGQIQLTIASGETVNANI